MVTGTTQGVGLEGALAPPPPPTFLADLITIFFLYFWQTKFVFYKKSTSHYFMFNRIYNKILDRDWFSVRLFVT